MSETQWYFPAGADEVPELLRIAMPHAGGTFILRMNLDRIAGLVDLRKLGLNYCRIDGELIRVGAMQTYSSIIRFMREIDPEHLLVKALEKSASESLRNRITVGGSVVSFPSWSDIMGPLLGLDASLSIIGKTKGDYQLKEYLENRELRKDTLITEISFRKGKWASSYHRETRTAFDYAIFTITVLTKIVKGHAIDCRIVLTGTKNRFVQLNVGTEYLGNTPLNEIDVEAISRMLEFDFPQRQSLDSEYIRHLARIQLRRALGEVWGR